MKLYYSPGVCSLSPHIVLREAGLDAELIKVDIHAHVLEDGSDFHAINPRGYVPILVLDNGEQLSEGPAIVQYLADLKPAAGLAPASGTMARYRLQEWLNFITSELHKGFAPLFDATTPDSVKTATITKLGKRIGWVAEQLDTKPYVLGEQFSVADAYLYTILNWCRGAGIDLNDWPVLAAYQKRVAARPAVRDALKAEGLLR
jgi:glutathione S-transferase